MQFQAPISKTLIYQFRAVAASAWIHERHKRCSTTCATTAGSIPTLRVRPPCLIHVRNIALVEPRYDACDTLDALDAEPAYFGRLTSRGVIPSRAAVTATLPAQLHDETRARLAARKLDTLYAHQAVAIEALMLGEDVVVATSTSSGKSLCYQVPIVDAAVRASQHTAIMLFPTKALAHDQLQSLRSWLVPGMKAVAYDGSTPTDDDRSDVL